MKIISKRISRNEFVSRKNGVIPSLVDMWMIPETQLNCGGSESFVFGTYESAAAKIRELGLSPSLLEYKAEFVYQDHNYGLIVSDIIIPDSIASNITDYTDIYVNIPDGSGGYYDLTNNLSCVRYVGRSIISGGTLLDEDCKPLCDCFSDECDEEKWKKCVKITGGTEIKVLTYTTLNKWYTFFKNYKQTIKMYDNAIGLYDAECEVKNEYNRKKYSDLDDLFNARGGDKMYDWLNGSCFPNDGIGYELISHTSSTNSFTANTKYVDYFVANDLLILYNKTTNKKYELKVDSFTKSEDTGGKVVCSLVNGETIILNTNDEIELYSNNFDYSVNSASYVIPILITNSIDDLGEMTMFSSKWKEGVDYSNDINEGEGTVVDRPHYRGSSLEEIYACSTEETDFDINTNFDDDSLKTSYETYLLTKGKGYNQNEYYENEFASSGWTDYTDWYIENNPSEFVSMDYSECALEDNNKCVKLKDCTECVSTYAYSHTGKVLYNPNKLSDCETIDYIEKDFILSDGESIDVVDGYYAVPSYTNSCVANVKLKKGIKIPVKTNGALKYAELNVKKFYALKDKNG